MLASSNLLDPAATHGISFSCTNATLFTSQRQLSIDPVECCTANLEGWLKYETKKTWQQEPEEVKLCSLKDKSETDFAKGHVRWQSFLGLLFKQYKRRIRNCRRVSLVFVPRDDGKLWHNCCWNTLSFNLFFFKTKLVESFGEADTFLDTCQLLKGLLWFSAAQLAGESYSGRHNFRSMSFCCWCEYITSRVLC